MMFLEFFIWGAWLPLIFAYLGKKPEGLGFSSSEQSWILNAFALASFTAMFFSTQFADRNFAAERFVAFSHLVGGLAMLGLFWVKGPATPPDAEAPVTTLLTDPAFLTFFGLMLLHCLLYVPTISITNSIAFANLKDPANEFGPVRLWGTIGWIAASLPFVFILVDWAKVPVYAEVGFGGWIQAALDPKNAYTGAAFREATRYTFLTSGVASLLLSAFSLALPHTPPKVTTGSDSLAWLEALKLLRHPFVLVLFVVTFIDATVHQTYFVWTERFLTGTPTENMNTGVGIASNWAMPIMSIGQVAEIGTMFFLGVVLKSLGWRATMIIGILGHAVRFAVFAFAPVWWVAISANLLHGICYAFFFATVYIFVDEFFPKDIRSSAQGLFNALILGLGPIAGNYLGTQLGATYGLGGGKYDFQQIFVVPSALALAGALLLLVGFWPPRPVTSDGAATAGPPPSEGIQPAKA